MANINIVQASNDYYKNKEVDDSHYYILNSIIYSFHSSLFITPQLMHEEKAKLKNPNLDDDDIKKRAIKILFAYR